MVSVDCSQKKFVSSTRRLRVGAAGRNRGWFCRCSVCAACSICTLLRPLAPSCAVLRVRNVGCAMVRAAKKPHYATAMFPSSQRETYTFPLSAGVSCPYVPQAPNKATETVIFFFSDMLAAQTAAAAGGSSSKQAGKQASRPARCRQASSKQAGKQQQANKQQASKQEAGKQAAGKQQMPL